MAAFRIGESSRSGVENVDAIVRLRPLSETVRLSKNHDYGEIWIALARKVVMR